jgi:heterotetrameric sarcosine oxidase gamma subunit
VSAPDAPPSARAAPIALRLGSADVVEIAPLRGRAAEMQRLIEARGSSLPPPGHLAGTADRWVLCVRPGRWLLLQARGEPGTSAAEWQRECEGFATVVDLSCALALFALTGPAAREALARGCRLELDPRILHSGRVARTLMAQVPVIIAVRDPGIWLLAPATTARHFHEWLALTARPFGLAPGTDFQTISPFGRPAGAHPL